MKSLSVNVVIFGGGAAGLWLLDELRRAGLSALLLENHSLGRGQTISSQGILHSGLKYMLDGLPTAAGKAAREMPLRWKDCMEGRQLPDLTAVQVRSSAFHLWGTDSASSRLGLFGAQLGLRVTPERIPHAEYPAPLRNTKGIVLRVNEQIISPSSLIHSLASQNQSSLLKIDPEHGVQFSQAPNRHLESLTIHNPDSPTESICIRPDQVILAAGSGNGPLREQLGLDPHQMQLRPLHMVQLRGPLPELHGHCVEGSRTRVSITSATDARNRTVWQVGGQIAEDGVKLTSQLLIQRAQRELSELFPHLNFAGTDWSTYRVNRAEGATLLGQRPDSFRILQDKNILTTWPTKLVLVPQLVEALRTKLQSMTPKPSPSTELLESFPRPEVSLPPWETTSEWTAWPHVHRAAA